VPSGLLERSSMQGLDLGEAGHPRPERQVLAQEQRAGGEQEQLLRLWCEVTP
jgi:hypothetical protein